MNRGVSPLVAAVWLAVGPAEGESLWYDDESGWETTDRREAVAWVRKHQRALRHGWVLPQQRCSSDEEDMHAAMDAAAKAFWKYPDAEWQANFAEAWRAGHR
jgi:hypothetical protein